MSTAEVERRAELPAPARGADGTFEHPAAGAGGGSSGPPRPVAAYPNPRPEGDRLAAAATAAAAAAVVAAAAAAAQEAAPPSQAAAAAASGECEGGGSGEGGDSGGSGEGDGSGDNGGSGVSGDYWLLGRRLPLPLSQAELPGYALPYVVRVRLTLTLTLTLTLARCALLYVGEEDATLDSLCVPR